MANPFRHVLNTVRWAQRREQMPAEYLNEQQYDENGKALLVEVPTRLDPLNGEPVESVYAKRAAATDWDERQWRANP